MREFYREKISGNVFELLEVAKLDEVSVSSSLIWVRDIYGYRKGERREMAFRYFAEECEKTYPYWQPPFDPDLISVTAADIAQALQYLDGVENPVVRFETTPAGVCFQIGSTLSEYRLAKNFEAAVITAAMCVGWERRG